MFYKYLKYLKIILFFILLIIFILINYLLPDTISWRIVNFLHKFNVKYILGISKKIIGNKNLFRKNGVIFISNHYNATDALILNSCIHNNTYIVTKSDLLSHIGIKNKFITKLFFEGTNSISYIRDNLNSGKIVKRKMLDHLSKYNNILVFPEGTSTRNGYPKEFKNGLFKFSAENNIPIVPITIKYKRQIGIKKGDPFKLNQILDNEATIYLHNILVSKDWEFLKKKSYDLITKPLK